ncbi:MAG: L-threonylcarbamoyladenylate synthase [Alkalispirochaetaceae bacterium]
MKRQQQSIEDGARLLREGGLVLFPTETVYGLGADAGNNRACLRIFEAKERPPDNPLIVHIADIEQLAGVCEGAPPDSALRALELFSPGPITVVVAHNGSICPAATTGLPTVAVRIPSHPVARSLLAAAAIPVAAPSANRSGRPSPTSYAMAVEAMEGRADLILDGGTCEVGLESTILDCTGTPNRILRPGGVTREMLLDAGFHLALPEEGDQGGEDHYRAPGSRYQHYRPKAAVRLAESREREGVERFLAAEGVASVLVLGLREQIEPLSSLLSLAPAVAEVQRFESLEEFGRSIYDSFFRADRRGLRSVLAILPEGVGVGVAIRDRLARAGTRL